MVTIGPTEVDQKQFNGEGMMIRKMLVVLCGLLLFQSYVFAETWEDRAANKTPWSAEFADDPACWNPPVSWNTENPWIVGKGDHEAYYGLANCFRVCAENDTCYKDGWQDEAGAATTCELWGIDQLRHVCVLATNCDPDSEEYEPGPPWWKAETVLSSIMKGFAPKGMPRKLYVMAWCE